MHVADRLDFRRLDGQACDDFQIINHPRLWTALRNLYAYPSARQPRWSNPGEELTSCWSVAHIGRPKPPYRKQPFDGLDAVFCYALTIDTWVNDVASLLATSLGYGLTTTRDLAFEVVEDLDQEQLLAERRKAHDTLLARPPRRRVWTHHCPPTSDSIDLFPLKEPTIASFWLRESDGLLQHAARKQHYDIHELRAARTRIDEYLRQRPDRVVILDVDYYPDAADRWQQVFTITATMVRLLRTRYPEIAAASPSRADTEQLEPRTGAVFLDWLADHTDVQTD